MKYILIGGADSVIGAGIGAGAAIEAGAGVDDVMIVALTDRAGGTDIRAGTTANTSVRNLIGHLKSPPYNIYFD